MKNKKTFTVIITDNETGEVVHDRDDVVALIGGITYADGDSASIGMVHTNSLNLALTVDSARKSIEEVKKQSPLVGVLDDLVSKHRNTILETLTQEE